MKGQKTCAAPSCKEKATQEAGAKHVPHGRCTRLGKMHTWPSSCEAELAGNRGRFRASSARMQPSDQASTAGPSVNPPPATTCKVHP